MTDTFTSSWILNFENSWKELQALVTTKEVDNKEVEDNLDYPEANTIYNAQGLILACHSHWQIDFLHGKLKRKTSLGGFKWLDYYPTEATDIVELTPIPWSVDFIATSRDNTTQICSIPLWNNGAGDAFPKNRQDLFKMTVESLFSSNIYPKSCVVYKE